MDRDTVFPDRLLRRMLDLVEEARRDDTDEVPPRSLIRGLAQLVPGLRCEFIELDWVRCQQMIGLSTDEDHYGAGFNYAADLEPDPTWRLTRQHPNCRYLRSTGRMDVVQLGDFVTTRQ